MMNNLMIVIIIYNNSLINYYLVQHMIMVALAIDDDYTSCSSAHITHAQRLYLMLSW